MENYKEQGSTLLSSLQGKIFAVFASAVCLQCVSVILGAGSVEWGSDEARAANDVCPQLK